MDNGETMIAVTKCSEISFLETFISLSHSWVKCMICGLTHWTVWTRLGEDDRWLGIRYLDQFILSSGKMFYLLATRSTLWTAIGRRWRIDDDRSYVRLESDIKKWLSIYPTRVWYVLFLARLVQSYERNWLKIMERRQLQLPIRFGIWCMEMVINLPHSSVICFISCSTPFTLRVIIGRRKWRDPLGFGIWYLEMVINLLQFTRGWNVLFLAWLVQLYEPQWVEDDGETTIAVTQGLGIWHFEMTMILPLSRVKCFMTRSTLWQKTGLTNSNGGTL